MAIQNNYNNNFNGFAKGSIPVTDASGNILQQLAPPDGSVLIADSSQTTGYSSFAPQGAPKIKVNAHYGSTSPIASSQGILNLQIYDLPGIATFSDDYSTYIMNMAPALMTNTISNYNTATNGYSYDVFNAQADNALFYLKYAPYSTNSSNRMQGPVSQEVQFIQTGSNTFSIQPINQPIQYGSQIVPTSGRLSTTNLGDSVTMRMNLQNSAWFVISSVGNLVISQS